MKLLKLKIKLKKKRKEKKEKKFLKPYNTIFLIEIKIAVICWEKMGILEEKSKREK